MHARAIEDSARLEKLVKELRATVLTLQQDREETKKAAQLVLPTKTN